MTIFDHTLATRVVVRVLDDTGEPVGAGMLLGPDLVATCAHVVADAARGDANGPPPARPVRVDVPMVAPGAWISARVARWQPIAADGSGDIAVLQLDRPVPAGARMPPLRRIDQLWGHEFRVLGFPEGLADGVWATGAIRGRQATGWHQLQATLGEQPIVGGFSGSPVWDDASGAVVGMTVATDATGTTTTAYLIPIDQVLGIDPELLPCPYRGLEPFGEEHAAFFFGRDDDIAQVMAVLGRQPLVAVAGPSGAGKSSLVRAGLLPRARSTGAAVVELRPLPGQRLGAADLPAAPDTGTVLLLVDQFEELAAADPDAARELLVLLGERLDAAPQRDDGTWPLQVVLTARSATLDDVLAPGIAARLGAGTVLVPPMDRTRLRDAIVAPAERAPGLTFEPGLVDRILDDAAAEPGHLPLVESLLAELWVRRTGGILTVEAYQRSGGVAGVVATRAEDVLRGLAVPPEDPGLRSLFVALVGTDRDGRFVRRPLPTSDVLPHLRPLANQLVTGRLLVIERPPGGVERLQLAHQALLQHWPRLRSWLAEDRTFVQWRDQAEYQRERWEATGRDDGGLLRGTALAATADWLPRRELDVPAPLREYVGRSRARQRRETRRWRTVTAVFAVLALAAGALAAVAVVRGNQVTDQLRIANAEVLAQSALGKATSDPVTAVALALEAHRLDPANTAATTAMARLAMATRSVVETIPAVSREPVIALNGSADGRTILFHGGSGLVVLTRPVEGPAATWQLPDVPQRTGRLLVSPDGTRIAVGSADGSVRVWDVTRRTGPELLPIRAFPGTLEFGADGRLDWLATDPGGFRWTRGDTSGQVESTGLVLPFGNGSVEVHPTRDPAVAVVRETTTVGGPATVTARSIADGAVRATLPPDVIFKGYNIGISCVAGSPRIAAVLDTATGAEARRIGLLGDCSKSYLTERLTGKGDLMEPRTGDRDRDNDVSRITRLSDGRTFGLSIPPTYRGAPDEEPEANTVLTATDGDGIVAVLPRGTSIVVARGEPDTGDVLPAAPISIGLTADGAGLLTITNETYTVIDRRTRRVLATLPVATMPEHEDVHALLGQDNTFNVLAHNATQWSYSEYGLPDLKLRHRYVLPSAAIGGIAHKVSVDAVGHRVAALAEGGTTLWDRDTGEVLGKGTLPRPGNDPDAYSTSNVFGMRPGADEVALIGPTGLELWNLRTGLLSASFPSPTGRTPSGNPIFDATGSRIATMGLDFSVQVWDVARRNPIGVPLQPSSLVVLYGFTADGNIALGRMTAALSADSPISLEIWDPMSGRKIADVRPSKAQDLSSSPLLYDGREVLAYGLGGALPARYPITVQGWQDSLCRLVDRPFTAAEKALLPAGVDDERPCG